MNKNMIDELICASPNRRSFLKTVGVAAASAGALALTESNSRSGRNRDGDVDIPADIAIQDFAATGNVDEKNL